MYDEDFTVETTADRVYRRFFSPRVDQRLKDWANDVLQEIQGDLDQVLRFDEGYEDHLLEYISREVGRADEREVPVCTCSDQGCKLKRGEIPHDVEESDEIERGIKQFKHQHTGVPNVLIEGRQAWSEKRGEVWHTLRRLEAHLIEDGYVPDPDWEWDGEEPEAEADAESDEAETAAAD